MTLPTVSEHRSVLVIAMKSLVLTADFSDESGDSDDLGDSESRPCTEHSLGRAPAQEVDLLGESASNSDPPHEGGGDTTRSMSQTGGLSLGGGCSLPTRKYLSE